MLRLFYKGIVKNLFECELFLLYKNRKTKRFIMREIFLRSSGCLFFLILFFLSGCGKKFEGGNYFPLTAGNLYEYSGMLGKSKVTQTAGDEKIEIYTLSYYDDAGDFIIYTEEYVVEKGLVFKRGFPPSAKEFTSYSFSPPLLFSPFSDQTGAERTVQSTEYRSNKIQEIFQIKVDYRIEKIEDVSVKAGFFSDCIKMRMDFTYLDTTSVRYMHGDNHFWYARGVGMVKYQTFGGSGELIQAKIGEKRYP